MAPFTQWIEDLIKLSIYDWIAYKYRLCMDEYNKTWNTFMQKCKNLNLIEI